MKVKNFITVTTYDETKRAEEREPSGEVMINVDEIALIVCVDDLGCAICLKDYATKIYCFDTKEVVEYKINDARGETK